MNEIIVLGRPELLTTYSFYNPAPNPSFTSRQEQVAYAHGINNVAVEEDVDDEIVVIARRDLKQVLGNFILASMAQGGSNYNIPCIGSTKGSEIASLMQRLKFKVTNDEFGPGRAGENNVGAEAGGVVPVSVNAAALQGYNTLPGGLMYLATHEVAHALKSMQEYNRTMWNQYVAGPGADLSHAERVAQYPNSTQFANNEARANTVAKAILAQWDQEIGFTPTHGYQNC